jgi:hypothetical protein
MTIHHSEGGFRFTTMAYDPKCEDLARAFLGDDAPEEQVKELAQDFQDAADDYIGLSK